MGRRGVPRSRGRRGEAVPGRRLLPDVAGLRRGGGREPLVRDSARRRDPPGGRGRRDRVGAAGRRGLRLWAGVAAVGALGWALFLPFWLNFHLPRPGFGLVHDADDQQRDAAPARRRAGPDRARRMGAVVAGRRRRGRATAVRARVVAPPDGAGRGGDPAAAPCGAAAGAGAVFAAALRGRTRRAPRCSPRALGLLRVRGMPLLRGPLRRRVLPHEHGVQGDHAGLHVPRGRRRSRWGGCGAGARRWRSAARPWRCSPGRRSWRHSAAVLSAPGRRVGAGSAGWPRARRPRRWRGRPRGAVLVEGVGDAYSDAARMSWRAGGVGLGEPRGCVAGRGHR